VGEIDAASYIQGAVAVRMALRLEIERSEESRYDHRLHGLLLLAAGHPLQGSSSARSR
jgi:hypothetical protein